MTAIDCNEVCLALARHASGAHAHTVGKAEFYLKRLVDKPTARFSNCTQDEFISSVRAALHSDKWQELSDLMGRWW